MQKTMLLMAALVLSLFISGCGGGSTSTSVVASTTDTLTATDLSGKTFHIAALNGTPYPTFHAYSTPNDWSSNGIVQGGTWGASSSAVTFKFSNTSTAYTITGIQKVSANTSAANPPLNYWLVSVTDATQKTKTTLNCRMYIDSATSTGFTNYTSSAIARFGLMGGAIQKGALPQQTFSNISTVTGTATKSGSSDGASTAALFSKPIGITTMDGTNFFVLDNNVIRKISPGSNGVRNVTTLALKTSSDVVATLNSPADITTDGTNLYVTDRGNFVIQQLTPAADGSWTMAALAGSSGTSGGVDGTGNTLTNGTVTTVGTARFANLIGITTDGTNLYVTDNEAIRKVVISTGQVSTLAGYIGSASWTADNVNGTSARFNLPLRITTDGTNLYVADCNNYVIRQIVIATGVVTTIAGSHGTPGGTDTNTTTGTGALFNGPNGITTDGKNLYVTDWGPVLAGNPPTGHVIRKITIADHTVTTIAGTNNAIGSDSSHFKGPIGITTDGASLFVTDTYNYTVRRVY